MELKKLQEYYKGFFDVAPARQADNAHRLYRCTAWVTDETIVTNPDTGGLLRVRYLYSYSTLVAMYDLDHDELYVYGRYSSTTYQHVRKFRNKYGDYRTPEHNLELVNWYH